MPRRILLVACAAFVVVGPARAQDYPPLSGAIGQDPGMWTGQAGMVAGGPVEGDLPLEPLPAIGEDVYAGGPGEDCPSCNGGGFYPYNRCGCNPQLFPYITGPGNCDNWCVGPHWNVELDGMFIHREDAEWDAIAGAEIVDEFEFGPGVRLFAIGYNCSSYGLQIGYEGVNDFHSTAVVAAGTREIDYQSNFNSVEINLIHRHLIPAKVFAGFRYIELDEDFVDITTATGDADSFFLDNRLMGFQIGAFRDAWELNRWITIEPVGNVGVYLNDLKREDVNLTAGVTTVDVTEFTEIAYVAEAGVTSVLRINRCLALRGGYQILAINGVGEALDASLAAGLDEETLIYHGARFGVEYQR